MDKGRDVSALGGVGEQCQGVQGGCYVWVGEWDSRVGAWAAGWSLSVHGY